MKIFIIITILIILFAYFLSKFVLNKYKISNSMYQETPQPSQSIPINPQETPQPIPINHQETPQPSQSIPINHQETPQPSQPIPINPQETPQPIPNNPQETPQPIPSICKLSKFSEYSQCNPTVARQTACANVLEKGLTCPSPLNQEGAQYCVTRECDVNCVLSDWTRGPCDPITKKQILTRTKLITEKRNGTCTELDYYGNIITPIMQKEEKCDPNCLLSGWSEWSECNPNYANNTASRFRTRTNSCKLDLEYEYDNSCPVNCIVSNWEVDTSCNKNTGKKNNAKRSVLKPSINGGYCTIDELKGTVEYKLGEDCPVNCEWGDWEYQNTTGSACNCTDNFIKRKIITEKNGGLCDIIGNDATKLESRWTPTNKTFNYKSITGNMLNTGEGCCDRYYWGLNRSGNKTCYSF